MPATTPRSRKSRPRPSWPARARKFLVAAAGLAAQVVASGALDDPADSGVRLWVQAGLAVLTAAGIYRVPTAKP